ncbi:MAG: hypothetical protein QOH96_4376, partial [Blastocatellia bacterium]|nr:hypothetical protein [Blastocatellia bacterium]
MDFQLVDVFGNAYAPPTAHGIPLMKIYNDELIPIDKWPGATAGFDFQAGTEGNAGLALTVTFQPDQVAHPKTVLAYYQVISDQLTDSRVSLTVTTALAAGPVNLTSAAGDNIRTSLGKFVNVIIAYLTAITKDPPTSGIPPSPMVLSGTVSISYLRQIGEDLFPIWVSIKISRTATDEYVYPDGFLDVVSQVSPQLSAPADDPAALRTWAVSFENAFYNFDKQNGLLKVAAGGQTTQSSSTKSNPEKSAACAVTSTPGDLWGLKWSSTDGVAMSFPNSVTRSLPTPQQQPVYFAPLPLSQELTFGSVQISDYDASGNPITLPPPPTVAFTGIDLDGWASAFLQAFEGLLSPEVATKIAQLNGDSYASLMLSKEQLAYAISSSITWILQEQMPCQEKPGLGDLERARDQFHDELLASLGADFGTSAIVQLPATVSVKNTLETDSDLSPKPSAFFGKPSPTPSADIDGKHYTTSTALLPITTKPGHLNFLVGTLDAGANSKLELPFFYDIE